MMLLAELVPTFRSSCSIAAPTFTNFGKSWALINLSILVPLYRSEVPDRIRRLWCRDFRSAVLVREAWGYGERHGFGVEGQDGAGHRRVAGDRRGCRAGLCRGG